MKNNKRKSGYNPERHTYMQTDGSYVYEYWDEGLHDYRKVTLRPGENGVTEELIAELDERDYFEDKNEQHQNDLRNKDYDTYLRQESTDSADKKSVSPLEIESYRQFLHPSEDDAKHALIELVAELVQELKPQQIELYYQLFGEIRQLQEIADMENTTRQSIYSRRKKIIVRIRKLLKENGIEF